MLASRCDKLQSSSGCPAKTVPYFAWSVIAIALPQFMEILKASLLGFIHQFHSVIMSKSVHNAGWLGVRLQLKLHLQRNLI